MAEQSVNVPQVLIFVVVIFLVSRWYLSKSTDVAPGTRAAANRAAVRVNPAHIDQVAEMLPQLSRRDIAWDLQRNGGNVAATTERALSGRGLDTVRLITGHSPITNNSLLICKIGTAILPNTDSGGTTSSSSICTSCCTSETCTPRPDNPIQPVLQDQPGRAAGPRRPTETEVMERRQEREAGKPAKTERRDDPGGTEKASRAGEGKSFRRCCVINKLKIAASSE